jgi:hypothetical protein
MFFETTCFKNHINQKSNSVLSKVSECQIKLRNMDVHHQRTDKHPKGMAISKLPAS